MSLLQVVVKDLDSDLTFELRLLVVTGSHMGVAVSAKVLDKVCVSRSKVIRSPLPTLGSPLLQVVVT